MNWTVSLAPTPHVAGDPRPNWGVYLNGRLVLAGYVRPADAEWALGYLRDLQVPPYLPPSTVEILRERLDFIRAHGKVPA